VAAEIKCKKVSYCFIW